MQKEDIQIVILKVIKTKNGKAMLQYGIHDDPTVYSKGLLVLTNWYETAQIFENITPEMILVPMQAKFVYKKSYNGTASMHITDITTKDGVSVLAEQ